MTTGEAAVSPPQATDGNALTPVEYEAAKSQKASCKGALGKDVLTEEKMPEFSSSKARETFVKYFESKDHKFWRSSPVVPYNDPTLLFVNAGMCQYKPIFLGDADKRTEFGRLTRAANTQKCIRAGGKHNDLEDVGKDVYHHTFFEMLGNWSFGDYFKKEAVEMAWELLTSEQQKGGYGLPKERLYATYFGGDEKMGLPADLEAKALWEQFLPASHVLPGSAKENFWEMGETGPCGPCSELHFDRIGGRECPELVNQDDPDVLEIWNLVFMQFNRETSGALIPLPSPCVDTGMGLERLVSVLNDLRSNYDTDLFTDIFKRIAQLCPNVPREYRGKVGAEDPDRVDLAYRAVADHIRTVCVAIADGASPSNEGRGYVVRRVLRRALRYGRQVLRAPSDRRWFCELADTVIAQLGEPFPELAANAQKIKVVIADEEDQFSRTLDRGTALFRKAVAATHSSSSSSSNAFSISPENPSSPSKQSVDPKSTSKITDLGLDSGSSSSPGSKSFSGRVAFELFATFGFPVDLTAVMCEEVGLTLDMAEFEAAMAEHQKNSQGNANRKLVQHLTQDKLAALASDHGVKATDDSEKYQWDAASGTGPDHASVVAAIYNEMTAEFVNEADASSGQVFLITDSTNFYSEAGGQVGDSGFASVVHSTSADGSVNEGGELVIDDCKKMGGYVLHVAKVLSGRVIVKDTVTLSVDFKRRSQIAKNHTGTHCLNFCLRKVLAEPVTQAGSIVDPARLRFDFNVQSPLSEHQVAALETEMTAIIAAHYPVFNEEVSLEKALAIPGLRSLGGENYPDPVRVVSVGANIPQMLSESGEKSEVKSEFSGENYSVEFCGGTHLSNSSDMGRFVVMQEEAIARGVRRLQALTGDAANSAMAISAAMLAKSQALKERAGEASDSEVLELKAELQQTKDTLSYLVRRKCASLIDEITAVKFAAAKERQKMLRKEAVRLATEIASSENAAHPVPKFSTVCAPALEGDLKAMEDFLTTFTGLAPRPIMLLSLTPEKELRIQAQSPKGDCAKQLPANEWIKAVLVDVAGKGGGKDLTARATAQNVTTEQVDSVCKLSRTHAEEKLA